MRANSVKPRYVAKQIAAFLLVGIACSWLIDHVSLPFFWAALVAIAYGVWCARQSSATTAKLFWMNAVVATSVLAVIEGYLWFTKPPPTVFDTSTPAASGNVHDIDFGYGPIVPSTTRIAKLYDGKPAYDVTYTVNEDGLRVSPPELPAGDQLGCVLFFGCSMTFGEGVEDDETMPWQVGLQTGGRYATRNLSYHGWGPHQMLAALQSGRAERFAHCDVTQVVYMALYSHAQRVAGRVSWDRHGPRYILDDDGRAVRAGYFSDAKRRGPLPQRVLERLKRSLFFRKFLSSRFDPLYYPASPGELDLFAAVILQAREEVVDRFPGASFDVLLWDVALARESRTAFTERVSSPTLEVHLLSKAIPDYRAPRDPRYDVSPSDPHPNADAHRLIAEHVVTNVLNYPSP
jgi:hypothetical protein